MVTIPKEYLNLSVVKEAGTPGLIVTHSTATNQDLGYDPRRMAINSDIYNDDKIVAPCNFRVVGTISHSQLFNTLYDPIGVEEIVVLTSLEDLEIPNLTPSDFPIKIYSTDKTYSGNYPVIKLRIIKNNGAFGDIYMNPSKIDTSALVWTTPVSLPAVPEGENGRCLVTSGDGWKVGLPISFYPVLISHNSENSLVADIDLYHRIYSGAFRGYGAVRRAESERGRIHADRAANRVL